MDVQPHNIRMMNGHVVLKMKKGSDTDLVSASGIILANVEQDDNIAEVVLVPDEKKYTTIERMPDGTPLRDDEDNEKEIVRYVTVKPGDLVLFEKKFHHRYDWRSRVRIDHCVDIPDDCMPAEWKADVDYEYVITTCDDILGTFAEVPRINGNWTGGPLYSTTPPKPITKAQ